MQREVPRLCPSIPPSEVSPLPTITSTAVLRGTCRSATSSRSQTGFDLQAWALQPLALSSTTAAKLELSLPCSINPPFRLDPKWVRSLLPIALVANRFDLSTRSKQTK